MMLVRYLDRKYEFSTSPSSSNSKMKYKKSFKDICNYLDLFMKSRLPINYLYEKQILRDSKKFKNLEIYLEDFVKLVLSPKQLSSICGVENSYFFNQKCKHTDHIKKFIGEEIKIQNVVLKNCADQDLQNVLTEVENYLKEKKKKIEQLEDEKQERIEQLFLKAVKILNEMPFLQKSFKDISNFQKICKPNTNSSINKNVKFLVKELQILQKIMKEKEYVKCLIDVMKLTDEAKKCIFENKFNKTLCILCNIPFKCYNIIIGNSLLVCAEKVLFLLQNVKHYFFNFLHDTLEIHGWIESIGVKNLHQVKQNVKFNSVAQFKKITNENISPKEKKDIEKTLRAFGCVYILQKLYLWISLILQQDEKVKKSKINSSYGEIAFMNHRRNLIVGNNNLCAEKEFPNNKYIKYEVGLIHHMKENLCLEDIWMFKVTAAKIVAIFRFYFQRSESLLCLLNHPEWAFKYMFDSFVEHSSILSMIWKHIPSTNPFSSNSFSHITSSISLPLTFLLEGKILNDKDNFFYHVKDNKKVLEVPASKSCERNTKENNSFFEIDSAVCSLIKYNPVECLGVQLAKEIQLFVRNRLKIIFFSKNKVVSFNEKSLNLKKINPSFKKKKEFATKNLLNAQKFSFASFFSSAASLSDSPASSLCFPSSIKSATYFDENCASREALFSLLLQHLVDLYDKWRDVDYLSAAYLFNDFNVNLKLFPFFSNHNEENKKNEINELRENEFKSEGKEKNKEKIEELMRDEDLREEYIGILDYWIDFDCGIMLTELNTFFNKLNKNENNDGEFFDMSVVVLDLFSAASSRVDCLSDEQAIISYVDGTFRVIINSFEDKMRVIWNFINDLILQKNKTCSVILSTTYLLDFLNLSFKYKPYLSAEITKLNVLYKKMIDKLCVSFSEQITECTHKLLKEPSIFYDMITHLSGFKKKMPEPVYKELTDLLINEFNKILTNFINDRIDFFYTEDSLNFFIQNCKSFLEEFSKLLQNNKEEIIYFSEIIKFLSLPSDYLLNLYPILTKIYKLKFMKETSYNKSSVSLSASFKEKFGKITDLWKCEELKVETIEKLKEKKEVLLDEEKAILFQLKLEKLSIGSLICLIRKRREFHFNYKISDPQV